MSGGPPYKSNSFPPMEDEATCITSLASLQQGKAGPKTLNAYLIVLQGSNVGEMYKIDGSELFIGRSVGVNIRLNDEGISRRHARIINEGGQLFIEDLMSANGTLVNGEAVRRQPLQDGDKILLGSTTILKFTYHDNLEESFQQKMYEAALRDGLTKAFNKKYFLDRIETEFSFAQRHQSSLSLVMFDIDFFKKVNDGFGHLAGDAALVGVSQVSHTMLRNEDVFARYGGEEFGIICRGTPAANAAILADRLRAAVEATVFDWQGARMPITISCGVAGMPETAPTSSVELISFADEALYESKRSGRNRVTLRER